MIFAFKIGGLLNTTVPRAVGFHGGNCGHWGIIIRGSGAVNGIGTYDFFKLHGWLMWLTWGVLGFLQLASNRYLKSQWAWHLWMHRITGTIILLMTLGLGILSIKEYGWSVYPAIHNIIGVIVISVVTLITLGGVFTRSRMMRLKWNTSKMLKIKRGHQLFGYIIIIIT